MLDYKAIEIDIETLGTRAGCSVLSIGACEFSDKGVGKQFYEVISLESCEQWGLKIDPRTVLWWFGQNDEARKNVSEGKKVELDIALTSLTAAFDWKGKQVWCNGASFDFPILTAAYDAIGHNVPWEYWAQMDYRTLKALVPRDVYEKVKVEAAVKHNALCDAVAQAETTIQLMRYLSGQELPVKRPKRAA